LNAARARREAGPTRAERQASTRAALLRSASHEICEHGLDGASIDHIATEAGYTKGAFYANFTSKEDLFLAMLDEKFGAEMARLEAALAGSGEAVDVARTAADDLLSYIDRDPEWPRLYQEFAVHAARNDAFRVQFAARQRAVRERMAELFARWTAALGIEPILPHADVAAMSFVMADGFLLDRIIDPELDDGLYATMCEVFLRGLMAMTEERAHGDCGSLAGRRPVAGAEGGGTTGPMSPSGASSRSTITGA
jgi:AcrR family transcriptional regulator